MPPEALIRCPYCQQGTLAAGLFCAFCGRALGHPSQGPTQPASQVYRIHAPQSYQPYAQDVPGGYPFVICQHCQTPNEPWLNVCKSCQRPIESTAHT
jgi:predicted amidophosphoribosyltransferase